MHNWSYVAISSLFLCDCRCCCMVSAMGCVNLAMTNWLCWSAEVGLSAGNQDYCWMNRGLHFGLIKIGGVWVHKAKSTSRAGQGRAEVAMVFLSLYKSVNPVKEQDPPASSGSNGTGLHAIWLWTADWKASLALSGFTLECALEGHFCESSAVTPEYSWLI